jgi:hypothetical protein
MSLKQLAIIIDDFSSRSIDRYDNVWLYDYGRMESGLAWDYYLNNDMTFDGYGDVDYLEIVTSGPEEFYLVEYSDASQWTTGTVVALTGNVDGGIGFGGYESFGNEFTKFNAIGHDGNSVLKHGDWVLAAFQDQLQSSDSVEIILIDIDNLDTFSGYSQYNSLFSLVPNLQSTTGYISKVEYIVSDWLNHAKSEFSLVQYEFVPTTLSMSISGRETAPVFGETVFLDFLSQNYITIVQSAPNVGGGIYDWSAYYPDVVSVGAWNVDENQQILAANETAISTVDIFANGLVDYSGFGWGANFGTSFATPRVAAEIINKWDALGSLNEALAIGEIASSDNASIVDWLVESISTDVFVNINDEWLDQPASVLSQDLTDSLDPTLVMGLTGIPSLLFKQTSLVDPALNSTPDQQEDTKPPELSSLSVSIVATSELGYEGYKITVLAGIDDDLSGNAGQGYSSSPSQIRLRSPSGDQFVDMMLSGSKRISGDSLSGIYEDSVVLPRFSESGQWTIEYVLMVDQVGNMDWLRPADLSDAGLPFLVEVPNTSGLIGQPTDTSPTPDPASVQMTLAVPIESIESIGVTPDGKFLVIKANGVSTTVSLNSVLAFSDKTSSSQELIQTFQPTPVFASMVNGEVKYVLPELFTGPPSLNLKYQLIDTTPEAVVVGSALNDFIVLQGGGNKAVDGGLGNDVIDGGVGSTFVSGGGGSNTFFLDGRAAGASWSTITDFNLGSDKATIWGWKAGVSKVAVVDGAGGAQGYQGLTLHFENLLPDGSGAGVTNSNLNSITLSNKTLSDFGASSLCLSS